MRRLMICIGLVAFLSAQLHAYVKRDLLQTTFTLEQVKASLVMNQAWVPYPDYADREGWAKLLGENSSALILQGEKQLTYKWQLVKATDYLEYERSGNRQIMEAPMNENNNALSALLMAELAEGKGRFVDQIVNGVMQACEMTTWALSAHIGREQTSHRVLPDDRQQVMDLLSGGMAQMLSWTYYFLHSEFDKIDPVIAIRLRSELQKRELTPYMEVSSYWWMAFNYRPGVMVNNWNPWCNANALFSFLLLENDKDKLAAAVYRTMCSVDHFINYVQEDGACEEGPSYWGHAAGKMYDYLQLLSSATNGKISLFQQPQVKQMGEYIVRSYVGDGWVVNFADASARGGGDFPLIYRYGKAVGSDLMKGYASTMNKGKKLPTSFGVDISRGLETLRFATELEQAGTSYQVPNYTWYPQTEFCYMRSKGGLYVAAKGGYNNESHNHNDAGTFSLYLHNIPLLIDAGVGTYTRQTFGPERYSIWTMQSDYHNLPLINGESQAFGGEYRATNVKTDSNRMFFSADIAGAYPEKAGIKRWVRSYKLDKEKLKIEDAFALNQPKVPNQINFLTWGKVDTSALGKVQIEAQGQKITLSYDPKVFTPKVEVVRLDDSRLATVWGDELYRVSLDAMTVVTESTYTYTVTIRK